MRERVGLMDISAFAKVEVAGEDADAFLNRLVANRLPRNVGGIVLTHVLNRRGRIELELTVARIGEHRFYLVCAAFFEQRLLDHLEQHRGTAMADVIHQDFVRFARAKGLSERRVMARHALRNALLPIVTLFGLYLPILVSGAVLIEHIFAWPGLGRATYLAVQNRDYTLVTGIAILTATLVVAANLLADVLYRLVDPRTSADA